MLFLYFILYPLVMLIYVRTYARACSAQYQSTAKAADIKFRSHKLCPVRKLNGVRATSSGMLAKSVVRYEMSVQKNIVSYVYSSRRRRA